MEHELYRSYKRVDEPVAWLSMGELMERCSPEGAGWRGMRYPEMRIGIDLGGTKIEALGLDREGLELVRYRMDTPREDYRATILAMADLVRRIEQETGSTAMVG